MSAVVPAKQVEYVYTGVVGVAKPISVTNTVELAFLAQEVI